MIKTARMAICACAMACMIQKSAEAFTNATPPLYWSEVVPGGAAGGNLASIEINRGGHNGTSVETIVDTASADLRFISELEFEPHSDRLYWTDRNAGRIQRSSLDGMNVETIVSTSFFGQPSALQGLAIDPAASAMFWSNASARTILKGDLDGGDAAEILVGLYSTDLALDVKTGKLFFDNLSLNTPEGPYDRIDVADVNGANRQTVISGVVQLTAVSVDALAKKLYWADVGYNLANDTTIRRANYDGSGVETIAANLSDVIIDLQVDSVRGSVFWTSRDDGTIKRSDLQGGNRSTLLSGLSNPHAILVIPEPANCLMAATIAMGSACLANRRRQAA